MNDDTSLTIIEGKTQSIGAIRSDRPVWSLDLAIELWLDAKFKHTQSVRTQHDYDVTLQQFRAALWCVQESLL